MIKLAIAEDNLSLANIAKEKLSYFDDVKIKYIAENGNILLAKLEQDSNIDLILMDIQMPEMDGIQATELVKSKYPQIKILVLTVFDDDINIFNAIKAGADGYLLKETPLDELYKGIQDTLNGGAAMNSSIAVRTLKLLRNPITPDVPVEIEDIKLSDREIEVLEQLSKGLSYSQVADNLCLSLGTVRKHIENAYGKLHAHTKFEAIEKAKKNRLI
ncbi:MAG TPA: response regulator transcription factor [Crocinitomicaceae bacterium]|nr:response regulator transcription factor [Crocinitomicaceae bacterium]